MGQTCIPLWELDALTKGIVKITAVNCPVETAISVPSADELNALIESAQYSEVFRQLGRLPQEVEVLLWIPAEHHKPWHPSGQHRYVVGNSDQWQSSLVEKSESYALRTQIEEDPLNFLTMVRQHTGSSRGRSVEGWDLDNPPFGSTEENAVLDAVANLVSSYGAAHICHPLTPETIIIASARETVELSTDPQVSSLWRHIIERRVVAPHFNAEVEGLMTTTSFDEPVRQDLANELHIDFPGWSPLLAAQATRQRQFEDKLISIVADLQSDGVRRLITHDFEPGEIGMNRDKIAKILWLEAQIERERNGIKEGLFERMRNKWIFG